MMRRMVAEVIFHDPNDVTPATCALIELDCDVEVLDLVDDCGPAVWVMVRTVSRLDAIAFFHWIDGIVEPLGGDLLEAGLEQTSGDEAVARNRRGSG